jgi:hypothetical protein
VLVLPLRLEMSPLVIDFNIDINNYLRGIHEACGLYCNGKLSI